jgi:hypothetical protein
VGYAVSEMLAIRGFPSFLLLPYESPRYLDSAYRVLTGAESKIGKKDWHGHGADHEAGG